MRAFGCDVVLEAVLTSPLRHAAGEIYFAAADFPTFVSKFDNDAHGPGADDSPLAFCDVGNLYDFAIDQRGDRANADGVADGIDVAPEWRLPMVNVFRRAKHFEIKTRPALAVETDRVALVKIDSSGVRLRLPR